MVRNITAELIVKSIFQKEWTLEDANFLLQEMAVKHGANAVINVSYKRKGLRLRYWAALIATGQAVVIESERMPCPSCGESIMRSAKRCRFCGTDISAAP